MDPTAPKSYLFNFQRNVAVANSPHPQTKLEQVVATTVDEALTKYRTAFPDAEVTQVQRAGVVTV